MILMNDFTAEPAELREAMLDAVQSVLQSGWYVLGKEVATFEKDWARTCGVEHGIGVGNGMDAIEISLRTLEIGPGSEVITTPMTAFATVLAIMRAGAIPVLADIDPDTALLSLESAKRCMSQRTKAIVLVHLYGQVRDMDAWVELCKEKGLFLIEDCAQAHLAKWGGKYAGSFGDMAAFSFYPTKNLGAVGDGGMVMTNRNDWAEQARMLRNYGQSQRYHHPVIGLNSRLDEIHAAMLRRRMAFLNQFTERRHHIAKVYRKVIDNKRIVHLLPPQEESAHVNHLYVVLCEERNSLQDHLEKNSIQNLIHYPIPIHKQVSCKKIKQDKNGLKFSEEHANKCLSIPCHPQMTDMEIENVVDAMNSFKGS